MATALWQLLTSCMTARATSIRSYLHHLLQGDMLTLPFKMDPVAIPEPYGGGKTRLRKHVVAVPQW